MNAPDLTLQLGKVADLFDKWGEICAKCIFEHKKKNISPLCECQTIAKIKRQIDLLSNQQKKP